MKNFYQNLQTAFMSAGWLMMGTGVMGWVIEGMFPAPYPTGSFIVGAVFVALSYAAKRWFRDKPKALKQLTGK